MSVLNGKEGCQQAAFLPFNGALTLNLTQTLSLTWTLTQVIGTSARTSTLTSPGPSPRPGMNIYRTLTVEYQYLSDNKNHLNHAHPQ